MAREFSPFLENLFLTAKQTGELVFNTLMAVEVTLLNNQTLRYADGEITVTSISRRGNSEALITPKIFSALKIGNTDLRHLEGAAPDAGELAFNNFDYLLTQIIPAPSRLFDNAKVRIYLCFGKPDGTFEAIIYFDGLVRILTGDNEEARMSVISQLSDKKVSLGVEITQQCLNELGDLNCGAQHLLAGAVCTKDFYDEVSGCMFYGALNGFSGIMFINPNGLVANYTGIQIGGGGWEDPGCVDGEMFLKTLDGAMQAKDVKAGESLVDASGAVNIVAKVEKIYTAYRYQIIAENIGLICSSTHHLTTGLDDSRGKPVFSLTYDDDDDDDDEAATDQIIIYTNKPTLTTDYRIFPVDGGFVYKFALTGETHKYLAGASPYEFIEAHNNKQMISGFEIQGLFN